MKPNKSHTTITTFVYFFYSVSTANIIFPFISKLNFINYLPLLCAVFQTDSQPETTFCPQGPPGDVWMSEDVASCYSSGQGSCQHLLAFLVQDGAPPLWVDCFSYLPSSFLHQFTQYISIDCFVCGEPMVNKTQFQVKGNL